MASETFLKKAIDSLHYPFYIIDTKYKILLTNKAAEENGIKAGGCCYKLTHGVSEPCTGEHCCPLKEVLRLKAPVALEHVHYDKNGKAVIMEVHGSPIFGEKGEITEMIEYSVDITERRRAEEELRSAYARLKETQAQLINAEKFNAIGRLASGVAHEVKNPLAVILQGVGYLEENYPDGKINKDFVAVIDSMKNSVRRADRIVRDLVDFSKVKELNIKLEDLSAIIEVAVLLVQHKLKEKGIELVKKIEKDLPKVLIDSGKMEQVLVNILLNAAQSIKCEGRITIRCYLNKTAVVAEVEDTGIGIPKEHLGKVFEPFFTTKGHEDGTGLGLSICKNIMDLHEASINIESKEGRGTKIILTFKAESPK